MARSRWAPLGVTVLLGASVAPGRAAGPAEVGLWRPDGVPQWSVRYGGFGHLDDLAMDGPDTGWAVDRHVGPGGAAQTTFVRLEAGILRSTQVVDGAMLGAVAALPQQALAVGLDGRAYQRLGDQWLAVPTGTGADLLDVSLAGTGDGWACGESATLLRWTGAGWQRHRPPAAAPSSPITSCVAQPDGTAWATSRSGTVLRFEHGAWRVVATPALHSAAEMALAPDGRVLVAGRGLLALADGGWQLQGDPGTSYRSVAWPDELAYLVADDRLARYAEGAVDPVRLDPGPPGLSDSRFERVVGAPDGAWGLAEGGELARVDAAGAAHAWPASAGFQALDLSDPATGWAGGPAVSTGLVGWSADGWTAAVDGRPGAVVWDLDLASTTDGWALGYAADEPGAMRMWRFDGGSWQDWAVDGGWNLSRLQVLTPDEAWAAGPENVVRWRGQVWTEVPDIPVGLSGALSVLRGGDDVRAWFGGYGAIHQLVGSTWARQPLPVDEEVLALAVTALDAGWAVTPHALLAFDGGAWRRAEPALAPGTGYVDMAALGGDVWMLLDPPSLLHRAGDRWEQHPLGAPSAGFRLLRLRPAPDPGRPGQAEVWLAGFPSLIARYRLLPAASRLALPLLGR
jgi:hypothetical protein